MYDISSNRSHSPFYCSASDERKWKLMSRVKYIFRSLRCSDVSGLVVSKRMIWVKVLLIRLMFTVLGYVEIIGHAKRVVTGISLIDSGYGFLTRLHVHYGASSYNAPSKGHPQ